MGETNALLIEAGYNPMELYLQDEELDEAMKLVKADADRHLYVPAVVVTRDLNIRYFNSFVLNLLGISHLEVRELQSRNTNIIHIMLQSEGSIFYRNVSQTPEEYKNYLRWYIYLFKKHNRFCQHDRWYREMVQDFSEYPNFKDFWKEVQIENSPKEPFIIRATKSDGTKMRFRHRMTFLEPHDFPQVWSYPMLNEQGEIIETPLEGV